METTMARFRSIQALAEQCPTNIWSSAFRKLAYFSDSGHNLASLFIITAQFETMKLYKSIGR